MKQTKQCPKCSSNEVIADARVIGSGPLSSEAGDLSVATFRTPEALVFKGKLSCTVSAWVCAECGYVELYADSPQFLKST